MKIGIIGTRGIPAQYGGFETLVEHLTKHLGESKDITVYCSKKAYTKKKKRYNNAQLKYISFDANGIQSIPYDIQSLFNSAQKHDIILILGVSGCIILPIFRSFYPNKKLIINIDGLEHKRKKWNNLISRFLKYSEKLAVKYGDIIIADNKAIQTYVKHEYNANAIVIAYGGDHAHKNELSEEIRVTYSIPPQYAFKVCRIEPENNVHLILEAFANAKLPLIIIGNWERSAYGQNLKVKFDGNRNLVMLDPIYNQTILDQIRSNCILYVHGHSAGGTNPSLVEAMSLGLPIFAFDVVYNRETTLHQARFFKNVKELRQLINKTSEEELKALGRKMEEIAKKEYRWEKIANQYYQLF